MLSAVTEMLFAHSMSRIDFEPTLFSHQRQVFPDAYAAMVKKYVMVGTKWCQRTYAHRPDFFAAEISAYLCGI